MKNFAVFAFFLLFLCSLQASDFVYHIQFRQTDEKDDDEDKSENQVKIIEKIFRDNFNPAGFTQINPFLLRDVTEASHSDFADDDADFIKNRIIMNKLRVTHFLFGEIDNMGDIYYVRVFFSAVSPSFRMITRGNFDCAVSGGQFAKCIREFAENFSENPSIIEESKRAKTSFQQGNEKEKARLIYGFLNVFPSDIGKYKDVPSEIIKKINKSGVFKGPDCEGWRIPTENEVALLESERLIVKADDYMTANGKSAGFLRPVAYCRKSETDDRAPQQNPGLNVEPEVIYGFLKVFPKDIGKYKKRPVELIDKINGTETGIYGCKTWRIPTEKELALLASRGIIVKPTDYLSADGKGSGLLRLVSDMPGYDTPASEPEKTSKNGRQGGTSEEEETGEAEPESKLDQDSRSEREEAPVKKSRFSGCSADIL